MQQRKKSRGLAWLITEGYKSRPQGFVNVVFSAFSLATIVFCVWLSIWGQLAPYAYTVIFFALTVPPAFLIIRPTPKAIDKPYTMDWVFATLTLASGLYLISRSSWAMERIAALDPLNALDMTAAVICFIAVLELCRRTLGVGFTLLVAISLAYTFWGQHLPGIFAHRQLKLELVLNDLFFTANGVFGTPVAIVATIAFLFVLFGQFFQKAGGGQFIFDIAAAFSGRQIGGQAKVAVVASGAFGTISGSPAADVATTGSVTIPMMIKSGYSPVFAAGVEAAASTGGALLPPIMGTAAFLMVEFTGIKYATICMSALVSGLLYYYVLFMQIHYRSKKLGFKPMDADEIPKLATSLKSGWLFIIPVTLLVYIIFIGYTPSRSAIAGILATLVISWLYKNNRILLKQSLVIIREVLYSVAPLVVACSAAGMLISAINLTGLVGKMTSLIFAVSGDSLLVVLVISAAISTLLGMGMPTPAVYVLTATLTAPAIIQAGVAPLPAHLFLIFFASMSAITPPVGVAAYTAAGIAEASPILIGASAVKLAVAAFLLPFMFVFQPALILQGSVFQIVVAIIFACIGLWAVAAGFENYFKQKLNWWKSTLFVVCGILITYPEIWSTIVGLVVLAVLLLTEYRIYQTNNAIITVQNTQGGN